jgi:adenosylmethionine-8-amino-7-oxononanoate aminotransferase
LRCAESLEVQIALHHQETAALILEPLVQCAGGMAMYHPIYLKRAREICDEYDVHLIADEIAVGFGRTGTLFACEQAAIKPDFMCLSKGITGGYLPLSVVLTTDEIYQAFYHDSTARGFLHSHSYTGNPLACSAALATLDIFESEQVLQANATKSAYLKQKMQMLEALPVKHVRQAGMIAAFDVETADIQFQRNFYQAALAKGLLLRPIGNTIYYMPPYVIDEPQMDMLVEQTQQILQEMLLV